jgi:hypothetical protein
MFAPAVSPTKVKNLNRTGLSKASISPHDDGKSFSFARLSIIFADNTIQVLILDARNHNFNFSKKTLDDLEKVLPKYSGGEITPGSLAMVAYTISSYMKKGVRTLSLNLNWVVLVREA